MRLVCDIWQVYGDATACSKGTQRGGENKLDLAIGRGGVICEASSSSAALPGKFWEMFECLLTVIDSLSHSWGEPADTAGEGAERWHRRNG